MRLHDVLVAVKSSRPWWSGKLVTITRSCESLVSRMRLGLRAQCVLLCCLLHFQVVNGWGPFTHQFFSSLDDSHAKQIGFRAGASAPDAFKHISPQLHNPLFASVLFQVAEESGQGIDFALGYGCHLSHDAVGHHTAGFLNPSEDHPLEFAMDSFIAKELSPPSFCQITPSEIALVVNASVKAAAEYPKIKAIDLKQAQEAVLKFRALTTAEAVAMPLNFEYKSQLIKESYCKVTTLSQVVANFNQSRDWSVEACRFWESTMTNGTINATEARNRMEEFVQNLFNHHNNTSCT